MLQTAAYWSIIARQVLTAITLWVGAARLCTASSTREFERAKPTAVAGLCMGITLYAVGYVAIGGEWFAMWQSQQWNGLDSAGRFIMLAGIVLIVLLIPDAGRDPVD